MKKFDVVAAVKSASREQFIQSMPKPKRVGDKRDKKPRYGYRWDA